MSKMYRPRGDFVLYRIENKNVGKLIMPDQADQGKQRVVVAVGPEVEDLQVGDVILTAGVPGVDLTTLPDDPGIWLTRQANVVIVVEDE